MLGEGLKKAVADFHLWLNTYNERNNYVSVNSPSGPLTQGKRHDLTKSGKNHSGKGFMYDEHTSRWKWVLNDGPALLIPLKWEILPAILNTQRSLKRRNVAVTSVSTYAAIRFAQEWQISRKIVRQSMNVWNAYDSTNETEDDDTWGELLARADSEGKSGLEIQDCKTGASNEERKDQSSKFIKAEDVVFEDRNTSDEDVSSIPVRDQTSLIEWEDSQACSSPGFDQSVSADPSDGEIESEPKPYGRVCK